MSAKPLEIDLSNHYGFQIKGQTSYYPPNAGKSRSIAFSFFRYAGLYFNLVQQYVDEISFFINRENDIRAKLENSENESLKTELTNAHFSVTVRIYHIPAMYSNACLALELFLKAQVVHNLKYPTLDAATKDISNKYSHNLVKLANALNADINLSKSDKEMISALNKMYSGIKRFQYPHEYLEGIGNRIPALEDVLSLAVKIRDTVEINIDKKN